MVNMKVATRLGLGFALVLLMLAALMLVGLFRLNSIGADNSKIIDKDWVKAQAVNTMNIITRDNARRSMELFLIADKAQVDGILQRIEANKKTGNEAAAVLDKLIYVSEARGLLNTMNAARARYVASFTQVIKLLQQDQRDQAISLMNTETLPALDALQAPINALLEIQNKLVADSGIEIQQNISSASTLMLMLGGVALLIGVAAALLITRGLLKQLGGEPAYAMDITKQIAAGDLAVEVDTRSDDQSSLLFAIKSMRDNLSGIVSQVRSGTDTIATASDQIAAGNMDLSSRTEQQASSLEETASSIEELTSAVQHNADNARHANQLAVSASEVASKGGAVVAQVVDTMGSINESSRKINDIIGVIDGIAFQTNILALNAAVEAARAGEQGRGFAVVATEVRSLAQRSASAAKEIKTLIGDSVEKVDQGARLVDQAGATMNEIVESIRRVTDIMGEITAASQEQTSGIEQIHQAITQMDQVTQQNAALVEEAAAASGSLQEQAGNLAQVVSIFRLNGIHNLADRSDKAGIPAIRNNQAVAQQLGRPAQSLKIAAANAPVIKRLEGLK
ncbi:methyl-accepting chemotaxis protein [Herminiimonas sp. CN]|uniref:methyl-accepting chemotaxis protein n=1 Tax=Herminiimonas sp. CN TaxID=1349818 RepID=UPI0006855EA6|nr:methyl-accepting chemotaxis protein [Herminiimonas sp. CN]